MMPWLDRPRGSMHDAVLQYVDVCWLASAGTKEKGSGKGNSEVERARRTVNESDKEGSDWSLRLQK